MSLHEDKLIENGRLIVAARRRVWDLERLGYRASDYEKSLLRQARKDYHALLKERAALVSKAQIRLL